MEFGLLFNQIMADRFDRHSKSIQSVASPGAFQLLSMAAQRRSRCCETPTLKLVFKDETHIAAWIILLDSEPNLSQALYDTIIARTIRKMGRTGVAQVVDIAYEAWVHLFLASQMPGIEFLEDTVDEPDGVFSVSFWGTPSPKRIAIECKNCSSPSDTASDFLKAVKRKTIKAVCAAFGQHDKRAARFSETQVFVDLPRTILGESHRDVGALLCRVWKVLYRELPGIANQANVHFTSVFDHHCVRAWLKESCNRAVPLLLNPVVLLPRHGLDFVMSDACLVFNSFLYAGADRRANINNWYHQAQVFEEIGGEYIPVPRERLFGGQEFADALFDSRVEQ